MLVLVTVLFHSFERFHILFGSGPPFYFYLYCSRQLVNIFYVWNVSGYLRSLLFFLLPHRLAILNYIFSSQLSAINRRHSRVRNCFSSSFPQDNLFNVLSFVVSGTASTEPQARSAETSEPQMLFCLRNENYVRAC